MSGSQGAEGRDPRRAVAVLGYFAGVDLSKAPEGVDLGQWVRAEQRRQDLRADLGMAGGLVLVFAALFAIMYIS